MKNKLRASINTQDTLFLFIYWSNILFVPLSFSWTILAHAINETWLRPFDNSPISEIIVTLIGPTAGFLVLINLIAFVGYLIMAIAERKQHDKRLQAIRRSFFCFCADLLLFSPYLVSYFFVCCGPAGV